MIVTNNELSRIKFSSNGCYEYIQYLSVDMENRKFILTTQFYKKDIIVKLSIEYFGSIGPAFARAYDIF